MGISIPSEPTIVVAGSIPMQMVPGHLGCRYRSTRVYFYAASDLGSPRCRFQMVSLLDRGTSCSIILHTFLWVGVHTEAGDSEGKQVNLLAAYDSTE